MSRPRVLMVTGVYDPETSGASLQARQLIATLARDVDFEVLTTSFNASLPAHSSVDGIPVTRVYVDPARPMTKLGAFVSLTRAFMAVGRRADVVHFHGFSQKTVLLIGLAKLFGKATVLKLTSVGHDDAETMSRRGGIAYASYRRVDEAIAVSPRLERAWKEAALAPPIAFIPNAVDSRRFRPASDTERTRLKQKLGWPADAPAVLFVGFFSPEKRPEVLYRAWSALEDAGVRSTLVFVGKTRSEYYEVDNAMADRVRADAARRGRAGRLVFVEHADDIAECYRAADVFALPTTREGLPNVLLEAMASALPAVITRLVGVTDWIVEDGITGRLIEPADEAAFAEALRELLTDEHLRQQMGQRARAHVERHFSPEVTASRTLQLYRRLLDRGFAVRA